MTKRILILANKTWEANPLVSVLLNPKTRPALFPKFALKPPEVELPLFGNKGKKKVAARLALQTDRATAEVWCINEMMDTATQSSSSSAEKARVFKEFAGLGVRPALVIAFGTAAVSETDSFNGCVSVGSACYIHNPYLKKPNEKSDWSPDEIGKIIEGAGYDLVRADLLKHGESITNQFIPPPQNASAKLDLLLSDRHIAVSNINITDYSKYKELDPEAMRAAEAAAPGRPVGSLETTHGIVRIKIPSDNFLFISGIANRVGYYAEEVDKKTPDEQKFAASYNAAITLAWLLPSLMR